MLFLHLLNSWEARNCQEVVTVDVDRQKLKKPGSIIKVGWVHSLYLFLGDIYTGHNYPE